MRFEVTNEPIRGGTALARSEVGPDEDRALFLARLWTHFGPAREIDSGFSYSLVERDTGICLEAYSGASGPSYRGDVSSRRLRPVVRALEELLAATAPIDCVLETSREIDYGGGRVRIGVRGGRPFEEEKKERRSRPAVATNYEDCLAAAKARGGRYGIKVGWQLCLEKLLPEIPDELEIEGRIYENCIGFGLSKKGVPILGFDEGDGIEEIPVTRIPWPTPLSPRAKLWLHSYEKWRKR